jgi:ABC-type nitrate/sulfonate/bicarbonate transport system substrate-binding protein
VCSTGKNSLYHSIEDLRRQPIGVSRMGSGSHIMSYVLAMQRGWDLDDLKFEIKGDFKSLRESLNDGYIL